MQTRLMAAAAVLLAALTGTAAAQSSLKDAYQGDFVVGAALNEDQITGQDAAGDATVVAQFNSISPENCLKWERVHPEPNRYDFTLPDQYVAFGEKNHMFIVGHNLVWHNQVPDWVFHDAKGKLLGRKALLARLKHHIYTVVGRYKGRINAWDVVNEVVDEDGSLRKSPWLKIIGRGYIAMAFRYAHQADPRAELLYNDYNLETPEKREGAITLVKQLIKQRVPITTVGLQGHYLLGEPQVEQVDTAISEFAKLGMKVAITELDVDVLPRPAGGPTADVTLNIAQNSALNPYAGGLPDSVQQQLAARYGELFAVFVKHRDAIDRVTLWGVTDADTWHNNWPIRGRTAYSLLFDRAGQPKPAFAAAIHAAGR